jgi:hypothetical protein
MAKSDVTQEQARAVIDRVSQELGLLVADTTGFIKVQGPTNKHRIYVQKSRTLNRIDTTVVLPTDDPAYRALQAPNGSIISHVTPDLEQLERVLRMLGDASLGTQTPNKPRPFAATKAPAARKPKPTVEPVSEVKLEPVPEGGSLKDRLAAIRESARNARVRRYMENNDLSQDEAEQVADKKASLDEVLAQRSAESQVELHELVAETGIQLEMN